MPTGYLDAHIHLWEFCLFHSFTSLEEATCLDECRACLLSNPLSEWLVGVRFNQENIKEKLMPDRSMLDAWFGPQPALLVRSCLHLISLNSAAMQRLDMHSPNGLFLETDVFSTLTRLFSFLELDPAVVVRRGWELLSLKGIDRVIDMAMDKNKRPYFERLDFYTVDWDLLDESLGFKIFLDGSLGARTAALSVPYDDAPDNLGCLNYDDDRLMQIVEEVHKQGKPVACHAIGDRAVAQFLRVISQSRHQLDRLEHLQYASHEQLDLLASLDIPVCIQPVFSVELPWARLRLGPARMETAYAWSLMRSKGIRLLAGSDAPVDQVDPLYAAGAAHAQKGNQHLDKEVVLQLFARDNWNYYGWKPGAVPNPG
ncbi:MAG TPA: amidohydrolase family protein [Syntrophomonadaceae bacterium]|nr:amidohydrolase family protein [Syntrophomonadaceae bacterium]